MKVVLIFFLMVFATCCDSPRIENPYTLSQKELAVSQVIKKAFVQLKNEKNLYPFGTAGRMMNQIKMLGLSLHYYEPIDIEQARELLVYSTTLFLKMINDNEQIRPYLQNYPFTSENIQIRIYLQMPDGSEPETGKLTIAEMLEGNLEYVVRNCETNRLTMLYEETFDEAGAKLNTGVGI